MTGAELLQSVEKDSKGIYEELAKIVASATWAPKDTFLEVRARYPNATEIVTRCTEVGEWLFEATVCDFVAECVKFHDGLPENERKERSVQDPTAVRYAEIRMEYLCAVWMCLYFLGCRTDRYWEKVHMLQSQISGYPTGICTYKAYGDVMWKSRQLMIGDRSFVNDPLVTYALKPIGLLRNEITRIQKSRRTPAFFHNFGRHFAFLQLCLYCQHECEKGKLPYVLLFRKSILKQPSRKAAALQQLRRVFGSTAGVNQYVLPVEDDALASLPPCVMGPRSGFYIMDQFSDQNTPVTGIRVRDEMLKSMRAAYLSCSRDYVHDKGLNLLSELSPGVKPAS